jgi:hypothetical protein
MSALLRSTWAAARAPESRLTHLWLPDDPYEAHSALVHVSRKTARRVTAASGEFDAQHIHDLIDSNNGGFSHHPTHGKPPAEGWMASYEAKEGSGQAAEHPISEITPEHIAAHRDAISEYLSQPNSYQGGWHDQDTGTVYLDASRHFHDEHKVRDFAADQHQKAYFQLHDPVDSGGEHNFSSKYMNPRQDPLSMKDPATWSKRYSNVGTEPHPRYHEYSHLYPTSDDLKAHHAEQGHHLARTWPDPSGVPMGPWRNDRWVERQEAARRQRGV